MNSFIDFDPSFHRIESFFPEKFIPKVTLLKNSSSIFSKEQYSQDQIYLPKSVKSCIIF